MHFNHHFNHYLPTTRHPHPPSKVLLKKEKEKTEAAVRARLEREGVPLETAAKHKLYRPQECMWTLAKSVRPRDASPTQSSEHACRVETMIKWLRKQKKADKLEQEVQGGCDYVSLFL
jgi:hypothetical protein